MEENGNYDYLAIILQCSSFEELLTAIDDIGEIMESDKRLEDAYIQARENHEAIQAESSTGSWLPTEREEAPWAQPDISSTAAPRTNICSFRFIASSSFNRCVRTRKEYSPTHSLHQIKTYPSQ